MENNTINNFDFDISLIGDFFKAMPQQGPGSNEETIKALSYIQNELPCKATIADIGCGTGRQTVVLAKSLPNSTIIAVDFLKQAIDGLQERIKNEKATNITALQADMTELPFQTNSFDLFWAEGSIYHIGLEKGLKYWSKFLRGNGFLVFSDCCWLSNNRPTNTEWFYENFEEIDSIENKCSIIEQCGYSIKQTFVISSNSWTENYYKPMQKRIPDFLTENPNSQFAKFLTENFIKEMKQYELYGKMYGYVFFIVQKR
ncbi:MAG: methyltransferase domain-containing protein [Bacteroidales bacterium]|nr:methyltransferase domain-containing protein [Bacteroidales bacterium]